MRMGLAGLGRMGVPMAERLQAAGHELGGLEPHAREGGGSGPTAEEPGFPSEEACFGLQFGHGLGVGLYESPMISRLHSLEHPVEIDEGDGLRAGDVLPGARRPLGRAHRGRGPGDLRGHEILTRFPAQELLVTGKVHVRGADRLGDSETAPASATR